MKALISLVLALLVTAPVYATDVTLTWVAPTANADGSTPALVGGYNIYSAATDAALTALPDTQHGGKANSVGKVLTYTYKSVAPGTYYYAITTWYCADSTNCAESAQSAHVSVTVSPPAKVPGPPANTKVTVTVSAP